MNREIRFRGKRIDNGKWIHGYLNATIRKDCACISDCWETQGVIPDTVGQYIGIRDKNGNRIYEGDIVCFYFDSSGKDKMECVVKYNCKKARFEYEYSNRNWSFLPCVAYEVEIKGNIHDNPELLK